MVKMSLPLRKLPSTVTAMSRQGVLTISDQRVAFKVVSWSWRDLVNAGESFSYAMKLGISGVVILC